MADNVRQWCTEEPVPPPPRWASSEAGAAWAATLMRSLVADDSWTAAHQLVETLRGRLRALDDAYGAEDEGMVAAANVLRHALKAAREEYEVAMGGGVERTPAHHIFSATRAPAHHIFSATRAPAQTYTEPCPGYRDSMLVHLAEYEEEVAGAQEAVAGQAADIVCCDEVVLTMGPSKTVERFLLAAVEAGRRPQVVAVESEPKGAAGAWAATLARRGLPVTLVPEAATFAAVARVDRVVLGARAVLGLAAACGAPGTHALLREARHHSVPVALLAETYRLTPAHRAQNRAATLAEAVVDFTGRAGPPGDVWPLKLVDVLVTQRGQVDPSYISQLHGELYHPDDYIITS